MCGIFACLYASESLDTLQSGCNLIRHRGPDHSSFGIVPNTPHVFGFHRLAINDLTEKGNQPLVHPEFPHIKVICNGEIYNHKLLNQMYNFTPSSHSDCEVILHLYQRFGLERTVRELDGYYAFIIFDGMNVYAARDDIGVRSLYMGYHEDSVYLASELKAIQSFCSTIFPFPNGNIWSLTEKGCGVFKNMRESQLMIRDSYHQAKETMRVLLEAAVDKRVENTERPIGCLLSGGLDSSLICALVTKKYGKPIHTFSIGLKGSIDLIFARIVANHVKSIHHEVVVTEEEMLTAIPHVIRQFETYDTTTIRAGTPMWLLCKYISEKTDIKVIYSGEGADELSGSYLYFKHAPTDKAFYDETHRLMNDLQYFDVLRCDKATAAHGLEVRVPFLDKEFMNYYLYLPPVYKMYNYYECEKFLLRDAFRGLLPDSVLWRTKEAFSDGVSTETKSWYEIIQDHVATITIPDLEKEYSFNKPHSDETKWYRYLFESYYHDCADVLPYYWLPKWVGNITNPSARVIPSYDKSELQKFTNTNVNKCLS
jgi:asparagine synthase (glutamine-hydrolysing)